MINFKVDESKCVNCGLCSSDCPTLIISNKTEFPTILEGKEENCLKCQHCLAICPYGAISIWDKEPENSIPVTSKIPAFSEMEALVKTRRSIRQFLQDEINPADIHNLISIASYAPTARNDNSVRFTVVDNRKDMSKLRDLVYNHIKIAFEDNRISPSKLYYNNFRNLWETKQIDVIFRDAPHLLITSTPKDCAAPQTDACIAMSYFELLANSNGIGSLWDGFAKTVFQEIVPELKDIIGIPVNHEVAAVLVFGKAKFKYARSIQNDNPEIKTVNFNK